MGAHTSSLALWPWARLGERDGLDVAQLAARCELTESDLRDPSARVEQSRANRLAELVCAHHGAGAAMAAAGTVEGGHFQLVEQAVRASATVADGFDLLVELFPLIHVGGRLQHGRTRGESVVRYADAPGNRMHPGYVELLFAVGLQSIRRETGKRVMPLRVTFSHVDRPTTLHAEVFGPDVQFGMRTNSLALGREDAGLPLLRADPATLARATRVADDLSQQLAPRR
jgi:hypothetical protein